MLVVDSEDLNDGGLKKLEKLPRIARKGHYKMNVRGTLVIKKFGWEIGSHGSCKLGNFSIQCCLVVPGTQSATILLGCFFRLLAGLMESGKNLNPRQQGRFAMDWD